MSDTINIQPPVKNEVRLWLDDVQHWVTITLTDEGLSAKLYHEERGLVDNLVATWDWIAEEFGNIFHIPEFLESPESEANDVPEPVQPTS